jgi:uncharacterized membrane protein YqjE
MDHQTTLRSKMATPSDNGSTTRPDHGVADFIDDLTNLAELQARLAATDLKETARSVAVPLGLTLFCVIVLAGCVSTALFGAGLLVASKLNIHQGWAMLIVASATAVLAAAVAVFSAVRAMRPCDNSFLATREELKRNRAWLRNVLVTRGHSRPRAGV